MICWGYYFYMNIWSWIKVRFCLFLNFDVEDGFIWYYINDGKYKVKKGYYVVMYFVFSDYVLVNS